MEPRLRRAKSNVNNEVNPFSIGSEISMNKTAARVHSQESAFSAESQISTGSNARGIMNSQQARAIRLKGTTKTTTTRKPQPIGLNITNLNGQVKSMTSLLMQRRMVKKNLENLVKPV